jgi:predicted flap endonuclease-1-like 5' DNA nuclease
MVLLQQNFLSKPVAIAEILLILSMAAILGWLLARLILYLTVRKLKRKIEARKLELADCRAVIKGSHHSSAAVGLVGKASKTVYPTSRAVITTPDNLKVIEGIGPKTEALLNQEGIFTYSDLAETSPIRISLILKHAGPRFQIQDPSSWPKQAGLAKSGKWDELVHLKMQLLSGKQA